jgi:hypothetical protein
MAREDGIEEMPALVRAELPDRVTLLVEKSRELDRKKAELSELTDEIRALKNQIQEEFIAAGMRQVKTSDGATVFLERREYLSVRPLDGETSMEAQQRAAGALGEAGLDFLVQTAIKIDLTGLRAHFDELLATGDDTQQQIATGLKSMFDSAEVFDIKVRRR